MSTGTRALVVVGGWAHPAEQTGPPTAAALDALGYPATVATTMDDAAAALRDHAYEVLVVHTCRFLMLDARYTEAQRAEYRYHTTPAVRAAIGGHLRAGRPMLALHTAPLCFDDWPEWPALVGARWDWQRSNHPPPGPFRVDVAADHSVTAGLESFTVVDELYRFVDPVAGSEVVATAVDDEGIRHPLAWLHRTPWGRVAYDSLGHDERSLGDAGHRDLLAGLLDWTVRG